MVFVNNSLVFQCPTPVVLSGSEESAVSVFGRKLGASGGDARFLRKPTPGVAPACPALAEPEFVARPLGLRAEASCPRPPPRICVKCPTYGRASRSPALRRLALCVSPPLATAREKTERQTATPLACPPPKFFCRENRKISFLPRFYTVSSVPATPGTPHP